MIAFHLYPDTDFLEEKAVDIACETNDMNGLFFPTRVEQTQVDLNKFSFVFEEGQEWPDYNDYGVGYILVSQRFRDFLEEHTDDATEKYQFLDANFVDQSGPKYYILNVLAGVNAFPDGAEPETISEWTFVAAKLATCNSIFRADQACSLAVAGHLAEKIGNAKFRGLIASPVPIV